MRGLERLCCPRFSGGFLRATIEEMIDDERRGISVFRPPLQRGIEGDFIFASFRPQKE